MYAIYLRKSREDKELEELGQGETLARHKRTLLELARRDGYKITKIYEEIVSGSSIADRPEMQKLLHDVKMKKYKGVLVMDTSRLARGSTMDQGIVSEAFKFSSTLIVTPSKTFDPTNKNDRDYFDFNLFFAKKEYEVIRERLQAGIDGSFDEGNYVGSLAPYGYDVVRINKRERTLKPNENAKYVEMIFNWYSYDHMTAGEIAKKLTIMNVPSPSGRKVWHRETIKDIVKNHVYMGKIRWNKRKKEIIYNEDGTYQKVKRRSNSKDLKLKDGKHEAIISEDTFQIAQNLAYAQLSVKHDKKLQNPFARLMFCKKCGKAMNFTKNRGNPRFIHAESMTCKVKSARYEDVLNTFVDELKKYVDDFEIRKTNNNDIERFEEHTRIISEMKSSLSQLKKKRERLFDNYEDGIYTKEEFLHRKNVYNTKIGELEQSIEIEESNTPIPIDYEEQIIKFSQVIETLKSDVFSAEHKNRLLRTMIDKIEYECEDLGRNKGGIVTLHVYLCS